MLKQKRTLTYFLTAILVFITFISSAKEIKVIATIYPYYLLAKDIGGVSVEVECLIPPEASPHTYSPVPNDLKKLEQADLVLANGLNIEKNFTKLLKKKGDAVLWAGDIHKAHKTDAAINEHTHHDGNPHLWIAPYVLLKYASKVRDELTKLNPDGAELYNRNYEKFKNDGLILDQLIAKERAQFKECSIIAYHDAFEEFYALYDINLVATVMSPGKEPSAKELAQLGKLIKKHNIKAIFSEPQLNKRSAKILAKEFGLEVLVLDPMGKWIGSKNTLDIYRLNWEVMKKGFQK